MTNFHLDTGRKLNVYKTCRRQPGGLVNVLCTFNLHPVSRGLLKKYLNYLRSTFPTYRSHQSFDLQSKSCEWCQYYGSIVSKGSLRNFAVNIKQIKAN